MYLSTDIYVKKHLVYEKFFLRIKSNVTKIVTLTDGKELFQKKPLGRRWYLISNSTRDCEFSTITSGTERKRGFVGIYPSQSGNSVKVYKNSSTIPVFLIDN